MDIIDRSDQPRSNEELHEALRQLEHSMVKDILKIPPGLAVFLPTIRRALMELISIMNRLY